MVKKSWHQNFKRTSRESRTYKGLLFHSKLEMKKYKDCELLQSAGEIKNLTRQVSYDLILPNGTPIKTPSGRTAKYISDIEYDDCRTGNHVICDVKGFFDKGSKFKIAVFESIYGVKVLILK